MWILKECTKCKEVKELSSFPTSKRYLFEKGSYCKKCKQEGTKEWQKANREHIKEYDKKWREANREARKEHNKKWREDNREHIKEYKKEYRKEYMKDPFNRFKMNVRRNISHSFKRKGFRKNEKSEAILGISINGFKEHIKKQFVKGMSLDNFGDWHLDHIIPLDYANNKEEVLMLCHYSNYQPLWAEENLSKYNSVVPLTNIELNKTFI